VFSNAAAQADAPQQIEPSPKGVEPVAIYFFWGDGCPHCAAAKPFLEEISRQNPNVAVRAYEVWNDTGNQQLLQRMATAAGFEPNAVPTFFVGDQYWVGYAEPIRDEIAAAVATCSESGCRDAGLGIIPGLPTPASTPPPITVPSAAPVAVGAAMPQPGTENPAAGTTPAQTARLGATGVLAIPLIGTVDLAGQSLALSTALIAFVDGFNPCSLWVLSVLLALTLRTGSLDPDCGGIGGPVLRRRQYQRLLLV